MNNTLKDILENVSDSYDDFVIGVIRIAKKYNAYNEIVAYLNDNPDKNTSDILEYLSDTYIFGNK